MPFIKRLTPLDSTRFLSKISGRGSLPHDRKGKATRKEARSCPSHFPVFFTPLTWRVTQASSPRSSAKWLGHDRASFLVAIPFSSCGNRPRGQILGSQRVESRGLRPLKRGPCFSQPGHKKFCPILLKQSGALSPAVSNPLRPPTGWHPRWSRRRAHAKVPTGASSPCAPTMKVRMRSAC